MNHGFFSVPSRFGCQIPRILMLAYADRCTINFYITFPKNLPQKMIKTQWNENKTPKASPTFPQPFPKGSPTSPQDPPWVIPSDAPPGELMGNVRLTSWMLRILGTAWRLIVRGSRLWVGEGLVLILATPFDQVTGTGWPCSNGVVLHAVPPLLSTHQLINYEHG